MIAKSKVRVKNIFILLGGISLVVFGIGFAIAEALFSWLVLYLLASNLEGMDDLRANLIIIPVLLLCLCSMLAGFCIFSVPGMAMLFCYIKKVLKNKIKKVVLVSVITALIPVLIYSLTRIVFD